MGAGWVHAGPVIWQGLTSTLVAEARIKFLRCGIVGSWTLPLCPRGLTFRLLLRHNRVGLGLEGHLPDDRRTHSNRNIMAMVE